MLRFFLVPLACIALLSCDAPWEGPSLPAGAHWIGYRALAVGPSNCGIASALVAGTSVRDVDAATLAACHGRGCNRIVGCWPGVNAPAGAVLLAVYTYYADCGEAVQQGMAAASTALYFIHWVGRGSGHCAEMMPAPVFVLYEVAGKDVPKVSVLTVERQDQSPLHPPDITDTTVAVES